MANGWSTGAGSWYSQYPGWVDPNDKPGSNALGVPDEKQGIALPSRSTLGRWFEVVGPDGRMHRLQQTDVGPAPWTGRGIDVSAAAADKMGYSPKNFPTNAGFAWRLSDDQDSGEAYGGPPLASLGGIPVGRAAPGYDQYGDLALLSQIAQMQTPAGPSPAEAGAAQAAATSAKPGDIYKAPAKAEAGLKLSPLLQHLAYRRGTTLDHYLPPDFDEQVAHASKAVPAEDVEDGFTRALRIGQEKGTNVTPYYFGAVLDFMARNHGEAPPADWPSPSAALINAFRSDPKIAKLEAKVADEVHPVQDMHAEAVAKHDTDAAGLGLDQAQAAALRGDPYAGTGLAAFRQSQGLAPETTPPPAKPTNVVDAVAQGMIRQAGGFVSGPSETYHHGMTLEQEMDWGRNAALATMGTGAFKGLFKAPTGELGVAGGKIVQPEAAPEAAPMIEYKPMSTPGDFQAHAGGKPVAEITDLGHDWAAEGLYPNQFMVEPLGKGETTFHGTLGEAKAHIEAEHVLGTIQDAISKAKFWASPEALQGGYVLHNYHTGSGGLSQATVIEHPDGTVGATIWSKKGVAVPEQTKLFKSLDEAKAWVEQGAGKTEPEAAPTPKTFHSMTSPERDAEIKALESKGETPDNPLTADEVRRLVWHHGSEAPEGVPKSHQHLTEGGPSAWAPQESPWVYPPGEWELAHAVSPYQTPAFRGSMPEVGKGLRQIPTPGHEGAYFSTSDPALASRYATKGYAAPLYGYVQAVQPLMLDTRNYLHVNGEGRNWTEVHSYALKEANRRGKSGAAVHDVYDEPEGDHPGRDKPSSTVYLTLGRGMHTVRSRYAQFNPLRFGDVDLLGALPLGMTVPPALAIARHYVRQREQGGEQ